jgi:ABC-type phosphate/phosphonate transport system permease subunit
MICNFINILLWCTVVGIIVAIPLKILVTTVLYSELSKSAKIPSKYAGDYSFD